MSWRRPAALLLVAAAGCHPTARGRCKSDADCRLGSSCAPDGLCEDFAPAVNVFIPETSDMVKGWVARTSGTLEVRALVDDGAGSGAASASLTLDQCPTAAPCSYQGVVLSRPSVGAALFSFVVPRAVQAVGSEAPVTGVITALDQAQNAAHKPVSLLIDDAPPAIGPVTFVTPAVKGEDGNNWFPGGAGAAPVEIAIAVTDRGVGLLDVALHLDRADVAAGTADPPANPAADGTVHFRVPASAVIGREGPLRFTLAARDALLNKSSQPELPASVFIDDVPPVVSIAAVNYASALPATSVVCAPNTSGPNPITTVICGRGPPPGSPPGALPDHVLRDDVVTVTFDAHDCGAGLSASSAGLNGLAAATASTSGTPCANSSTNPIHHYTVQLDFATQTPGPPDLSGTEKLPLDSDVIDFANHRSDNKAGVALISIVRWRSLLFAGLAPTGSPALLPGPPGTPRNVVIGTNAAAPANNLFIFDPKGTQVRAVPVATIVGDVAVDKTGVAYAVSSDSNPLGNASTTLSMFDSAANLATTCPESTAGLGAPPVIVDTPASPLAVLAATTISSVDGVYVFKKNSCAPIDNEMLTLNGQTTFTGASAEGLTLFFSHATGFTSTSFDPVGGVFDQGNQTSYGGTAAAIGGAAIFGTIPNENPLFAGGDRRVHHSTFSSTACNGPCWDPKFDSLPAGAALNGTPVFDGNAIYVTDAGGIVYAFAQQSAVTLNKVLPILTPPAKTIAVSSPVLVGAGQVLVVQRDALVRLLSPALPGATTLLQMKTPGGSPASYVAPIFPPTPVVDARGSGGVAYIPDGAGWVWAVQIDQPPVKASATTWPRPGRDSCNSRNTATLASACP